MKLAVLALALAACGRKTSERTCEKSIDAAFERVGVEQRKSGVPSAGSAIVAGTRLTMIASCEADKWSDDVLGCIETARLEVDLSSCHGRLTHDQWERLQRKLSTLRASVSPPDPPPAQPDAAPAVTVPGDAPPVIDAMVISPPPPVDGSPQAEPPRVVPPVDAAPSEDCSRQIRNPSSARCRQQFCQAHPTDPRCEIE